MKIDRKRFYQEFRPYFREVTGGNVTPTQVKNLEFLLDGFERSEWFSADVRRMAYALATIHIETYLPKINSRYAPVREGGGKAYFIRRYWNNTKIRKQLGNQTEEDAWRRCGRGFVQETGLANDIKFAKLTGIDLVSDPDLAMVPDNALKIMEVGMIHGTWTGRKIGDYIGATTDYKGARRVINGQDRAAEIAGYARNFEHFLRDAIATASAATSSGEDERDPLTSQNEPNLPDTSAVSGGSDEQPPTSTESKSSWWTRMTARFDGWGEKADKIEGYAGRIPMSVTSKLNVVGMKVIGLVLGLWGVLVDHPVYAILGTSLIIAGAWYLSRSKDRNAVAPAQAQAQTVVVEK